MRDLDKLKPLHRESRLRLHLSEGLETFCRACEADKKNQCDKCSLAKWRDLQTSKDDVDCELMFRDIFSKCHKCAGSSYVLCPNRSCGLFRSMRVAIAYAHGYTQQ
jgi:hypothetical protein